MCVLRICSLLMVMVAAGLVGRGHSHAATRFVPKQNDPVTEQWRWRMFQELNGLGVRCMVEDTEGAIWFGLDRQGPRSMADVAHRCWRHSSGMGGRNLGSTAARWRRC